MLKKKLYSLNTNYSLEEVFCKILFVVVYTDITTNAHGSVVAPGCNQLLTNLNTFEYTYNVMENSLLDNPQRSWKLTEITLQSRNPK